MKTRLFIFLTLSLFIQGFSQETSKNVRDGMDHFSQMEYNEALKCFLKEERKNSTTEMYFWIGYTYAALNEIEEAKPYFLKIIKGGNQGPEYAMSLVNLGNCYRKEKPDSAYYYYDLAISEFPGMADAYYNKGTLLYAQSKFEEARVNFDKAIEIDSSVWTYFQKRLEVCFATNDFESALTDMLKVRELNPEVRNEMNLAFCYSKLERYQEADSIFQMIYNENDALFLNNYGMNKHNMGATEEGKALIQKSLSIKADNAYAYRNLAVIALAEGNKSLACEYLHKADSLGFAKNYGDEVQKLMTENCN